MKAGPTLLISVVSEFTDAKDFHIVSCNLKSIHCLDPIMMFSHL